MKKVKNTSKFLFGIYWWTLKTRKIIILKKRKKIAGDIIILHMCTKNYSHMRSGSWDAEWERPIFLPLWAIFWAFTPLTTQKIKTFKNWKKTTTTKKNTWIYHHLTQVKPKMMIICYTVPEIWHMTDVISIFHFGLFFPLLPTNNPKNQNFEKIKKNTRRYHYSTQMEP